VVYNSLAVEIVLNTSYCDLYKLSEGLFAICMSFILQCNFERRTHAGKTIAFNTCMDLQTFHFPFCFLQCSLHIISYSSTCALWSIGSLQSVFLYS